MKLVQSAPLLNKLLDWYRSFRNVYRLEERSQPIDISPVLPLEFIRPAVSLLVYRQEAQADYSSMIDALKSQLDQNGDELIVVNGEASANGKKLNTAIQAAKNPLLFIAFSNTLPRDNWLKLMTVGLELHPQAGYAIGSFVFKNKGGLHALARHSAKLEYLPNDLMVLRKQAWARAGGFPAGANIDKAEKIFNLRLQNTSHSHLIVKNAIADYEGTVDNIWIKAFRSGWDEGGLGLFAPVIWKQVRFMLALGLLIFIGTLLLLIYPAIGTILLLLGVAGAPILRGWRISPGQPNRFLLKISHSLLAGWIEIIHWIGYIAGVNIRKKERLLLDLESEHALTEIISAHPDKIGIIILSPTVDWSYMFQRYQQMARQFARQNYLVFYHTHNSQSDAFAGFQEVEPGLIVTSVPLETFGTLTNPIFYVNSPWLAPMIAWLKDPIVLYDHCDDISVSSGLSRDHHDLLKRARLVFASSTKLLMEDRVVREDTIFLPNAVDYDWAVQNMPADDQAIPEDLRHIIDKKKPIIGYTGALAEWFDYELLREVCIKCPEMEFVLIGVDYDDTMGKTDLLECRNVTWLGHKHYQTLFQYIWYFNVAIIPFRINKITLATSPVKLFEYFACQKPVVSTALPECIKYDAAFIAHNADQFRSQLQKALAAGESEKYITRVTEIARENTWQARVGKIIDELSNGGRFELHRS